MGPYHVEKSALVVVLSVVICVVLDLVIGVMLGVVLCVVLGVVFVGVHYNGRPEFKNFSEL